MPRSIKPVSQRLDDLNLRVLTWENLVSEGGLEPHSWWYIPKRGIHHQSKLTRQGPAFSTICILPIRLRAQ
jgi:hypothetical protein